jgi:hypothetical protein
VFYGARRSLVIESPGVNSQKPFPSPGDLPHQGIKARPLALQGDSLLSEPPDKPLENASHRLNIQQICVENEEYSHE